MLVLAGEGFVVIHAQGAAASAGAVELRDRGMCELCRRVYRGGHIDHVHLGDWRARETRWRVGGMARTPLDDVPHSSVQYPE